MNTTFTERFNQAQENGKISRETIARALNVTVSAVGYWASGKTDSMRTNLLEPYARLCGVSLVWLVSGLGDMDASKNASADTITTLNTGTPFTIPRPTYTGMGLHPGTLSAFEVVDDSLSPELPCQTMLLIDPADTEITEGMLYAFNLAERIVVRRAFRRTGGLTLRPISTAFPDEVVGDLTPVGRIRLSTRIH